MGDTLRESYSKEIKNPEEGLEKINELQQPSEEEDRLVLIRNYKEYINCSGIWISTYII